MKFCAFCGVQHNDDDAFCSNCGNALPATAPQPTYPTAPVSPQPYTQPTRQPYNLRINKPEAPNPLMAFLGALMAILGATFTVCGVAASYISVSITTYSYKISGWGNMWPDITCSVFAIIFGVAGIVFSVINLVQSATRKAGSAAVFSAINRIVASLGVLAIGIVMASV
jgi:hypothetical protein